MLKKLLLLVLVNISILGVSQENITLTYTGNMGVYLSDGGSSVLIDGLHTKYGDDYLFPTKKLINRIHSELQPNVILFTHRHGDHFSIQLSKDYLVSNKKASLFGAHQITKNFNDFKNRMFTITTKDYKKQTTTQGDIKITGLKINHAGKRHVDIENVGYIITLSKRRILHVGDTNWMREINLFDQLQLQNENIDIAVLPYWMLMDDNAEALIKKHISPKQIIATHISPRIKEKELQSLKNRYPAVHFLTKLEEQIQL